MKGSNNKGAKDARGQAIIIFAIGIILILCFAGLAIDASNAYGQRRRMQNAADAAALAGTRKLAVGGATNAQVLADVVTYLSNNGGSTRTKAEAQSTTTPNDYYVAYYVTTTGLWGAIPNDGSTPEATTGNAARGVYVEAHRSFRVFLGGLLGMAQKTASANATARYAAGDSLDPNGGFFPVAFPEEQARALTFAQTVQIWTNNRFTIVGSPMNGSTGWLDVTHVYNKDNPNERYDTPCPSGCNCGGAQVVKCFTTHDYEYPLYAGAIGGNDGDFIDSKSGVTASILDNVTYPRDVIVPLFDYSYQWDVMDDSPLNLPEPTGGFSGRGPFYHVVGFSKFRITGTDEQGNEKCIQGQFMGFFNGRSSTGSSTTTAGVAMKGISLTDVMQGG